MARFTGASLVMSWLPSTGGTITLSSDFQSVDYTPSGKLVTATAGADAFEVYLASTADTKVSYTGLLDATSGTATETALAANTFGTLIIQPQGTATSKRKYTVPAYSGGANISYPFDNVVSLKVDFQGSGTPTVGVN